MEIVVLIPLVLITATLIAATIALAVTPDEAESAHFAFADV